MEFYLDDELVSTDSEAPYSYLLYPAPELGSDSVLSAVAVDTVGNRNAQTALFFTITANQPPTVLITAPGNVPVSLGQTVTVRVVATDDVGINHIAYTANNGALASESKDISAAPSSEAVPFTLKPRWWTTAAVYMHRQVQGGDRNRNNRTDGGVGAVGRVRVDAQTLMIDSATATETEFESTTTPSVGYFGPWE